MEDRGWIRVDGSRWRWGENWAAEMMQTRGPAGGWASTTPPSLGGREVLVGVWFVKLMKNGTIGSYICDIYIPD